MWPRSIISELFSTFNLTYNLNNPTEKQTEIVSKNLKWCGCTNVHTLLISLQQSFSIGVHQHGTSWIGNICLLFFAKTLQICQIVRACPVQSPLQVTPQIFNRIQDWPLAGLFQNCTLLLVKPFFCWFQVVTCSKLKSFLVFSFLAEARFCTNTGRCMEGRPVLGNYTDVPYFLHLMTAVFTVFHGRSLKILSLLLTNTF